MSSPASVVATDRLPGTDRGVPVPTRLLPLPVGWPLTALLVLYPVWWLLGMGTLIVFALAVPMALHLLRNRPVAVPPGFGLWLLFLVWVVLSTGMLGVNPPNTVVEPAAERVVSAAFNLASYVSATVVLLYAGNLSEEQFPRRRLVRQLGFFFVVVVAGGLLGLLAPAFELTSVVERLLPGWMASNSYVQSLVHPIGAQWHDVLGHEAPRPAAPFGYTNTWGECLALLLGWFVVGWLGRGSAGRRLAGVAVLAVAVVPVVHSLNRGLWIALGLVVLAATVRLARRGRVLPLAGVVAASAVLAAALVVSPLSQLVESRVENGHSNSIRTFTTVRTLEAMEHSPVLGFGSTRATLGSANSIAIGQTPDCEKCGNHTLGSNGQIWLVLIAQGWVGAALYTGYFLRSLWVFRRDRTPIGDAGLLACGLPLFFMFIYNAVTVPLVLSFLSIALLWRNRRDGAGQDPGPTVPTAVRGGAA